MEEKEGTRPLTSPLPLIWYHARFVSAGSSCVSTYTYSFPHSKPLYRRNAHRSYCASNFCMRATVVYRPFRAQ